MKPPARGAYTGYLDTAAVILSGICLIHCLALPVAFALVPIFNVTLIDEPTFHLLMLVVILPISLLALTIGWRQHNDRTTLILGGIGLSILAVTAIFGHDMFGETGERIVTSIGGLILAAAHIQNFRCCRQQDCEHDDH